MENSKETSGVEQIIHCFIHGTNDLKALLLEHADTIFECKNCRMLFRKLHSFVEHKAQCKSDIKDGLCFNGTDLGNRAGKDLKNVLNWMLPQRQNIQQAILEIKKENGDKTENKSENLRVERNQSGCSSPDIGIKAPLPLNESQNDTIPAHEVIVSGSDCPLCNKTFATKNNCRRHVREMHGMNPVSRSKF